MLDKPAILPDDPEELRSFTACLLAEVKAQAIVIELADWVGKTTALLEPLADAIGRHVLSAEAIFADGTPEQMLAPGTGKTLTARLGPLLCQLCSLFLPRALPSRVQIPPHSPVEAHRGAESVLQGLSPFFGYPNTLGGPAGFYGPFCGLYATFKVRNLACKVAIFVFF